MTTKITNCPNGESNCPIYDDLAQLREKVETLSAQVSSDFLTGLYNRQHLLFALEQEMERTQRSQQPTSLIMLDIDHFKRVNDQHGHVAGDKVLKSLANVIRDTVRKIDVPCRYGGEEFAIVLPSTPMLTGVQVAERLRAKIADTLIPISKNEHISVTASLGVHASLHNDRHSAEEFIELADKQLYLAKESGRNQVKHQPQERITNTVVSPEEKDALFNVLGEKK